MSRRGKNLGGGGLMNATEAVHQEANPIKITDGIKVDQSSSTPMENKAATVGIRWNYAETSD